MATFIGNIFKEANICNSDSGQFIAFTLVESESYKTKDGKRKKRKTYFNCVMWNAIKLAPYLTKDIPLSIKGTITAKTYKDATGKYKASVNVLVKDLEFIQYPRNEESTNDETLEETFDESAEIE